MKIRIAERIGGIDATIEDDLRTVILEGLGRARLSYANNRPGQVIINYIETNPFDHKTNTAIDALLRERGHTDIIRKNKGKAGKAGDPYRFGLTDEQKKQIADEIDRRYSDFKNRLLAGKIEITAKSVGCDFPHLVLSVPESENWDYFYYLTAEDYGIYDYYKWGKASDGDTVTEEVIAKIKEIDQKRQQEADKKARVEAAIKDSGKTVVHINECWECGSWQILGGRDGRLPREVWKQARDEMTAFRKAAAEQISDGTLLSSFKPRGETAIPNAALETEHFIFFIVSREYCGC